MVELTREHMGWVHANRWMHFSGLPHTFADDLIGAGMLGLVRAAQRYDPTRGASFRTYAYDAIHHAMQDHQRTEGRRRGEAIERPADPIADWERIEGVRDAMRLLDARTQRVLWLLAFGLTLREIGDTLGVTEGRVCQIAKDGRARLRRPSHCRRRA